MLSLMALKILLALNGKACLTYIPKIITVTKIDEYFALIKKNKTSSAIVTRSLTLSSELYGNPQ